jgi:FlaA1/EpsC-like NDP-sugar epimerase
VKVLRRKKSLFAGVEYWPRALKRAVVLGADVIGLSLAFWAAVTLKTDHIPQLDHRLLWLFGAALVAALVVFQLGGLYRQVVRFIVPRSSLTILWGVLASLCVVVIADRLLPGAPQTSSVFVVYAAMAVTLVAGSRWIAVMLLNTSAPRREFEPIIVYGAGQAGRSLADSLFGSREFRLAAFLDDDIALQNMMMQGVRVYSPQMAGDLVERLDVKRILLALPSVTRRRRQEIIARLEPLGVHVQTVPEVAEIVAGRAQIEELREIDVRDLLGRDPVPANESLLDACIRGKSVLVTGAGGSIGSELCRQIVQHDPAMLVLFEMSEAALYNIQQELAVYVSAQKLNVKLVPLIGNAHHKERVREILKSYRVQTIYHAAAYKHVPLVEHNMIEGVQNNVVATWYAAEAALDCDVETFVLISTDKAVNPTNVMGATKRLAELVLQGLHQRRGKTRFCIVRFGNVLASSGSVVPLFQQQIRSGGPITVTHPDVIRYFMTIEEAAALVIQAGSIATGGDVFVLDMGKPVRIADLAARMVTLAGLSVRDAEHPDGDIEVVYTGLRPAEKMFEELLIGSNVSGTEHPRILRAVEKSLPWAQVEELLLQVAAILRTVDCGRARDLLMAAVREYQPSEHIQDLVWMKHNGIVSRPIDDPKVTDLKVARARLHEG